MPDNAVLELQMRGQEQFLSAFKQVASQMGALQNELRAVSAMSELASKKTREITDAQAKVADTVEDANKALEEQQEQTERIRKEQKKATKSTDDLADSQEELTSVFENMEDVLDTIEDNFAKLTAGAVAAAGIGVLWNEEYEEIGGAARTLEVAFGIQGRAFDANIRETNEYLTKISNAYAKNLPDLQKQVAEFASEAFRLGIDPQHLASVAELQVIFEQLGLDAGLIAGAFTDGADGVDKLRAEMGAYVSDLPESASAMETTNHLIGKLREQALNTITPVARIKQTFRNFYNEVILLDGTLKHVPSTFLVVLGAVLALGPVMLGAVRGFNLWLDSAKYALDAMRKLPGVLGKFRLATIKATLAQIKLNIAAYANPYVLVAVAVVALVAALGFLLHKMGLLDDLMERVKVVAQGLANIFKAFILPVWDALVAVWESDLKPVFTELFSALSGLFGTTKKSMGSVDGLRATFVNFAKVAGEVGKVVGKVLAVAFKILAVYIKIQVAIWKAVFDVIAKYVWPALKDLASALSPLLGLFSGASASSSGFGKSLQAVSKVIGVVAKILLTVFIQPLLMVVRVITFVANLLSGDFSKAFGKSGKSVSKFGSVVGKVFPFIKLLFLPLMAATSLFGFRWERTWDGIQEKLIEVRDFAAKSLGWLANTLTGSTIGTPAIEEPPTLEQPEMAVWEWDTWVATAKAIWDGIQGAWDTSWSWLTGFFSGLMGDGSGVGSVWEWDTWVATAKAIWDGIQGAWDTSWSWLTGFFSGLMGDGSGVGSVWEWDTWVATAKAIWDGIQGAWDTSWSWLTGFFSGLMGDGSGVGSVWEWDTWVATAKAIWDGIQGAWDTSWSWLTGFFSGLMGDGSGVGSVWEWDTWVATAKAIWDGIQGAWDTSWSWLTGFFSGLMGDGSGVGSVWEWDTWVATAKAIWDGIQGAWDTSWSWLTGFFSGLMGDGSGVGSVWEWDTWVATAKAIWDGIQGAWDTSWSWLTGFFSGLMGDGSGVGSVWEWDTWVATAKAIWDGIQGAWDTSWSWLTGFFSGLMGDGSGVGSVWEWDTWVATAKAIWDGIQGAWDTSWSWLTGFFSGLMGDGSGVGSVWEWDTWVATAKAIWDGIQGAWDTSWSWLTGFFSGFSFDADWSAMWSNVTTAFLTSVGAMIPGFNSIVTTMATLGIISQDEASKLQETMSESLNSQNLSIVAGLARRDTVWSNHWSAILQANRDRYNELDNMQTNALNSGNLTAIAEFQKQHGTELGFLQSLVDMRDAHYASQKEAAAAANLELVEAQAAANEQQVTTQTLTDAERLALSRQAYLNERTERQTAIEQQMILVDGLHQGELAAQAVRNQNMLQSVQDTNSLVLGETTTHIEAVVEAATNANSELSESRANFMSSEVEATTEHLSAQFGEYSTYYDDVLVALTDYNNEASLAAQAHDTAQYNLTDAGTEAINTLVGQRWDDRAGIEESHEKALKKRYDELMKALDDDTAKTFSSMYNEIDVTLGTDVAKVLDDTGKDMKDMSDKSREAGQIVVEVVKDMSSEIQKEVKKAAEAMRELTQPVITGLQEQINGLRNDIGKLKKLTRNAARLLKQVVDLYNLSLPDSDKIKYEVVYENDGVTIHDLKLTIPEMHKGGIVTAPTLAHIAENNKPEAVIPLDKLYTMMDKVADISRIPMTVLPMSAPAEPSVFVNESRRIDSELGKLRTQMSSVFGSPLIPMSLDPTQTTTPFAMPVGARGDASPITVVVEMDGRVIAEKTFTHLIKEARMQLV